MSEAATRARELLEAATDGPWRVAPPEECEVGDVVVYAGGCGQCECSFGCEGRTFDVAGRLDIPDAELIAAAPTLLAELADEVEAERSLRIQLARELLALTRAAGLPDPNVDDFGDIGKRTLRALITVNDAMVERAARALCDSWGIIWGDEPEGSREDLRRDARVVLKAALGVES